MTAAHVAPPRTPPPKRESPPLALLLAGNTLNRFDAVRQLRDWTLNTTISQLEARGLRIDREDEIVPGHFGPVHCKRYRLAPESRQRATELLAGARSVLSSHAVE